MKLPKLPKWHYEWMIERDSVVKTYDIEKFKNFYNKWRLKGVYRLDLPSDEVIEVSMRKMVYHMASSTKAEKEEAEQWLIEHGSSTEV